MSEITQLLLPAIRWEEGSAYENQRRLIELSLELGVGGFILFGGEVSAVADLTSELRSRSRVPLLLASDLERGAGQQFRGATGLPPLAAIGSLDDPDAARRAGGVTAREASALGLNWVFAPDADVDLEPDNPIIGTRSFGKDPARVADLVTAWVEGCQEEGVLACAKHFPGHGRTTGDSHATLPVVDLPERVLRETDILPFRAAIKAGVASIMSAHIAFPSLDPSHVPATMSPRILGDLLRADLRFDGLIVTDALIMEGALGQGGETNAALGALKAGCDLLLYPPDVALAAAALENALDEGVLDPAQIRASLDRRSSAASRVRREPADLAKIGAAREWAEELATRTLTVERGDPRLIGKRLHVVVVDDDLGGPYPLPSREPFLAGLKEAGLELAEKKIAPGSQLLVALFGDIRAWKGRPGYSRKAKDAVRAAVAAAKKEGRNAVIVQFSHPRLAASLDVDAAILSAWGGEAVMQRAAARWLTRGSK